MALAVARTYRIQHFNSEIDWDLVDVLCIDQFPWFRGGLKQLTYVKVARTRDAVHLKVKAIDRHSSAHVLEVNGSVYKDSCFEFFVTPKDGLGSAYLNFEINCIGTLYLAYNNGAVVRTATQEQIKQVRIQTSLPYGKSKEVGEFDWWWEMDVSIPFSLIDELYPHGESKSSSDTKCWYGNFYRCGGDEDDQYATWSPVGGMTPNFHQPMFFGKLEM